MEETEVVVLGVPANTANIKNRQPIARCKADNTLSEFFKDIIADD